jgi:hypothetical protein
LRAAVSLVVLIMILPAGSAPAAVFLHPPTDRELVDRADAVVMATVVEAASRPTNGGSIVTDYRLRVDEALKGAPAEEITVTELGGRVGDRVVWVTGGATYQPGERVVTFLRRRGDGTYFTAYMSLGRFALTRAASGESIAVRDSDELRGEPARLTGGFARFVRESAGGKTSRAGYATKLTPIAAGNVGALVNASQYCLLANGSIPVRWQNGESGATVTMQSNGAMAGLDTSGALSRGAAAWTNEPLAFINVVVGAPDTGAATPAYDHKNVVYFGYNTAGDPAGSVCDGGQACTIGGGGFTHTFKGETFVSIDDADIIIRPGVTAALLDALMTHELGHAIGLRHSNDPGAPSQTTNAVMSGNVPAQFGANLQQWDRDADDTVYGNGPVCSAPSVSSTQGGGTVASGQSATLSVIATGTAPLQYQWFDGSSGNTANPIGGANSSTYQTPPITTVKSYWVKVANSCGTSESPTITVTPADTCTAPVITLQPVGQTISAGGTASLSFGFTGSPGGIQWYEGAKGDTSKPVSGANSQNFTTPVLNATKSYWARITNQCGTADTNAATVVVQSPDICQTFTVQPQSATVPGGKAQLLFATASGSGATSYQWFKGSAGDVSTPLSGMGAGDPRFVTQIYVDLLGRQPSSSELGTFTGLLGGVSRAAVAQLVLASSEYRTALLTDFYNSLLHRPPSSIDLSFWLPALTAGVTDEQVEAQIAGSPEYFVLAGGSSGAWVQRLFLDVLGRPASAGDVATYTGLLSSTSRANVALSVLNSVEARTRRVNQYFSRYLRRAATAGDIATLTAALSAGQTGEQVIASILASEEYNGFGSVLATDPVNATTSYWVRASGPLCATNSQTATLTVGQCTPPTIVAQPQNVSVTVGNPASVSVLANGAVSYQWYRAQSGDPSNPVPGGTGPVLTVTLTNVGPVNYWVKVSNSCGSATSATVTVTTVCGPRTLVLSVPPSTASGVGYAVSWNGSSDFDTTYNLQEATKADFSDAVSFSVAKGTFSRNFTHAVTADTRYYYRVQAAPVCGGNFGPYSAASSIVVAAPPPSNSFSLGLTTPNGPCVTGDCKITGNVSATYTRAGSEPVNFTVAADKPWITFSPVSGPVPDDGIVTVGYTIDPATLDTGSTQATITFSFTLPAGKAALDATPAGSKSVPVSVSKVAPVTGLPKDNNAPPNTLLIPAVAHADGSGGSRFVSDVRVTNTAAQTIVYQLTFTPANTDGTLVGKTTNISVDGGQTMALNDIVKDWYGSGTAGEPGQGTLEIRPLNFSGKDVSVSFATAASSRTYNVTSKGTYGQYIPAIPLAGFLAKSASSKISLQQVANSPAFRTNIGFAEGSGQPAEFTVRLFGGDGKELAARGYSLKPFEQQQPSLAAFFAGAGITLPSINDARVEVKMTSDTGRITAYASVLDNQTSDPLLVFPVDPTKITGKRFVVPGVAELTSPVSNFHTSMDIFNSSDKPVDVTLNYAPNGGSAPAAVKMTLQGGEVKNIPNVLPDLWNIDGSGGAVVATVAQDTPLILTARTYSRDGNGGTFGQFIPGVGAADSVGLGERSLQVVQLENSPAYRTNLGLVEVTGKPVTIEIQAYNPDSKAAAKTSVTLGAGQFLQQGSIFPALGFTNNVYNGRISVTVTGGTGRVAAYGSVIDNRTSDPTYVPAQ